MTSWLLLIYDTEYTTWSTYHLANFDMVHKLETLGSFVISAYVIEGLCGFCGGQLAWRPPTTDCRSYQCKRFVTVKRNIYLFISTVLHAPPKAWDPCFRMGFYLTESWSLDVLQKGGCAAPPLQVTTGSTWITRIRPPLSCHRKKRALHVKYARKRNPSILVLPVAAS
jgi:hypothetical protein